MKRDIDLIRQILLKMEELPLRGKREIAIAGRSQDEISFHLMLMYEEGLIEAHNLSGVADCHWRQSDLQMQGMTF